MANVAASDAVIARLDIGRSRSIRRGVDSGPRRELLSAATVGVGNEVKPLPDVGRARAVCSQYRRRNGVARRFQLSTNKVEPAVSNRGSNLLSKEDWRAALADEGMPERPEVTRVVKPLPFARGGEGWAGAASGPDGPGVGPAGLPERERPEASAGEEVALAVGGEVSGPNIDN